MSEPREDRCASCGHPRMFHGLIPCLGQRSGANGVSACDCRTFVEPAATPSPEKVTTHFPGNAPVVDPSPSEGMPTAEEVTIWLASIGRGQELFEVHAEEPIRESQRVDYERTAKELHALASSLPSIIERARRCEEAEKKLMGQTALTKWHIIEGDKLEDRLRADNALLETARSTISSLQAREKALIEQVAGAKAIIDFAQARADLIAGPDADPRGDITRNDWRRLAAYLGVSSTPDTENTNAK